MATINTNNQQPPWVKTLFNELIAIRNSHHLIQQKLTRIESVLYTPNSSFKRTASTSPAPSSKRRQLVNKIANSDLPPGPCINHRLHGSSTRHCLGNCNFQAPTPIPVTPSVKPKKMVKPSAVVLPAPIKPEPILDWNMPSPSIAFRALSLSGSSSDSDNEEEDKI